jgi:hypothetical protein
MIKKRRRKNGCLFQSNGQSHVSENEVNNKNSLIEHSSDWGLNMLKGKQSNVRAQRNEEF